MRLSSIMAAAALSFRVLPDGLIGPKSFELAGKSQVNRYPDDVSILHWLLNLDVLVGKHLYLLSVVPESRVKTIKQDCGL